MNITAIEDLRYIIAGLHKSLRKTITDDGPFSLTELQTIGILYRNEKMRPSELAAETKITTPSMSQILKKLDEMGLVYRTPSEKDQRKVYISLTEKGISIVAQAKQHKNEKLQQLITTKLTADEIAVLENAIPVLKKLNSL